jgi:hypothetical protein
MIKKSFLFSFLSVILFVFEPSLWASQTAGHDQEDLVAQLQPAVDAFMADKFKEGQRLAQAVIDEIVAQDPEYQCEKDMLELIRSYANYNTPLNSGVIRECAYWIADLTTKINKQDAWGCTVLGLAVVGIHSGDFRRSYLEIMALLFTREDLDCNLDTPPPSSWARSSWLPTLIGSTLRLLQYHASVMLLSHPNVDLSDGQNLLQEFKQSLNHAQDKSLSSNDDERLEGEYQIPTLKLLGERMDQKIKADRLSS